MPNSRSTAADTLGLDGSAKPDSRVLAEALRTAIRHGRLPAGSRVRSTRSLAHDLGVARGTVSRAYDQLIMEGFLQSRQGAATTVADRLTAEHTGETEPGAAHPRAHWDFRPGRPDLSAFPRREWLAAGRRALLAAPAGDFDYGDPQGHPALRSALAHYLARTRSVATAPERIVICNGYSEALSLLGKALHERGIDVIDFEDPSSPQFRSVIAHSGMRARGVDVDDHGIEVAQLHSPAVVVTPAHQFPLGVTMRSRRRTELVQRTKTGDRLVIEDDYDGEFRFDRQPAGSVQGMAPDHVVYAGSASKTLAPALRLAWLALPAHLVEPVRGLRAETGLHAPLFEQLTLAELIRSGGYEQHVRRSRSIYRRRRENLLDTLTELGIQPYAPGISAGLHLTARLQSPEQEVLRRARENSVDLEALGSHWVDPGEHAPGVVIGYAAPAEQHFDRALRALAHVLDG